MFPSFLLADYLETAILLLKMITSWLYTFLRGTKQVRESTVGIQDERAGMEFVIVWLMEILF